MSQPRESVPRVPELGAFRLGEWSVQQAEGTLISAGRTVRLEPRVMDVLVCLALDPGRVVQKEELLESVWGGVFVEEGALSQAVHSLRKALGDDARHPCYIQTIPKRGYRLLAPVVWEAERGEAVPVPEVLPPEPPSVAPAASALPATVAPSRSRMNQQAWLLLAAAGVAVLAILWLAVNRPSARRLNGAETAPAAGAGSRIVVLPFESRGKPEDAFFADGLTEEITKDLASRPALQVISRLSAMRYAGKPLSEIGRELKVDYVLEGTVHWAEGPEGRRRMRITPQLIRVSDDSVVWTETYQREAGDIFEVRAEISRRVIGQLGITLMPEEHQALREEPTEDLEAYQPYLRGLELANQPFYSESHLKKAVASFDRAVKLDPDFTRAWAELSLAHSYLAFNTDRSPERVEKARYALERAAALDPELLEVRLARAYFTYRCLGDFDAALGQLTEAARLYPNNPEILQTLGFVLRRQGRLRAAVDALQQAYRLDPGIFKLVWAIAETQQAMREYEQADRSYQDAISLAPDEPFFWEDRALNRLSWTGELSDALEVVGEAPDLEEPGLLLVSFQLDLYGRKYEEALQRLSPEKVRRLNLQEQSWLDVYSVIARDRLGDHDGALKLAERNRAELERRAMRNPKEAIFRAYLAMSLAQLGREAEALAQAERAVVQTRNDAFDGPRMVEVQAMVEATLGHRREALSRLTRLLSTSYRSPISVARLHLDPVWDPLRGDPELEALLARFDD